MIVNLLKKLINNYRKNLNYFFLSIILGTLSAALESLSLILLMPFVSFSLKIILEDILLDNFYFKFFNNGIF